jgi:hypothetical protein
MRAVTRVARAMAMATKRAIVRKRAMVSNDDNETVATTYFCYFRLVFFC